MNENNFLSKLKHRSLKNLPQALFVAILLATLWATYFTHKMAVDENQEKFKSLSSSITRAITTRFDFYENSLLQTKALFMQNKNVTSEEFQIYVHNIGLVNRYPGMTAIGYVEYVPASRLNDFIQDRRAEGQTEYRIWPYEEGREFYTPVKYIEPFFRIIREIRGFDMVSNYQRRNAMVKSAADGKSTVTEEVSLFVSDGESTPVGFNIFIPVYNTKTEPSSRKQRIEKTQGYVLGIFSARHLFNIIMEENNLFERQAAIEIFLERGNGSTSVYNSDILYKSDESKSSFFEEEVKITMANKNWLIKIRSLKNLESQLSNNTRWIVLLVGTLLAFSFWFFTRHIQKSKISLERSEKEQRKLAQSNSLLVEAAKSMGSTLDTSTLLKRLANYFIENFSDCCVIHVRDSNDKEKVKSVVSTHRQGEAQKCEDTIEKFANSQHIVNYVHSEGQPIFQKTSRDLGNQSFVSIPMIVRNVPFAVVNLLYNGTKDISQDDMNLLQQAVKVGSTYIENSLLYVEAQLANRLKDEFLATVSHELRTPLMIIMGYSSVLSKKKLDADVSKSLKIINQAAINQSTLIEDLLDVSAIISGKVRFHPKAVKVSEIAESALENVKLAAQAKNITLHLEKESDCQVLGEKVRLQQIVWNLLSNSIKFTPQNGMIEVKIKKVNEERCHIIVKDNGQGIEPEFLPYVFDKFRQEEKTSTRAKGGLGLGLSIVASLVELHGGSISAHSEGKGKGSEFLIELPQMSAQNTIEIKNTPEKEKQQSLKDIKILILDDDQDALDLISRILKGYDAEVITSDNVNDALKLMKENNVDVIVSDLAMPERDGIDFIREIRGQEAETGNHIPAILLTAFAREKDKNDAFNEGYDSFISKPVEPDYLVETVRNVLDH